MNLNNWVKISSNNKISLIIFKHSYKNQSMPFVKRCNKTITSYNSWIPKIRPSNSWAMHANTLELKSIQWKNPLRKAESQRKNSNSKKINSTFTKRNLKKPNPKSNSSNKISNTTINFITNYKATLLSMIIKI